jgi:hypothetical protein
VQDYKPKTRINQACRAVEREIRELSQGGKYAAGTASEGYAGGYRDALYDIVLLLNGTVPRRRGYWEPPPVH